MNNEPENSLWSANKLNISIIIPTYRRPEYVRLALSSIEKNVGLNDNYCLAVWLVDDSPDNCIKQIYENYHGSLVLKFINVSPQTPVGLKRNLAVKKTSDKLLIFMDSDIELTPNFIKESIDYLKKHPSVGMVSPKVIYKKNNIATKIDRPRHEDRIKKNGATRYLETNFGRTLVTYKDIFEKIGGYDYLTFPDRGEGVDLSCRYWRAGFPIAYTPRAIVFHHQDAPDSLTRSVNGNMKMLVSIAKLESKYDITQNTSPHFYHVIKTGKDFQKLSQNVKQQAIITFRSWTKKHLQELREQKKNVSKKYDFKPQDIFTLEDKFIRCVNKSTNNIRKYYEQTFN